MALSGTRLGVAVAVNGLALTFLAATLIGGSADLQATASRVYLMLMMMAPMALCVLLALLPLQRNAMLKGVAVVTFATLLATSFDHSSEFGAIDQTTGALPQSGQLARH